MTEPPEGLPPSEDAPGPGGAPRPGDTPDLVGTVLAGRYRVLSVLGEGAMGTVFLGEHLKIGRRDAIKVLRPSMARDPEAIARFTRGARNASSIRHPNVCAIYDFGVAENDLHFLAMEYVEGGTLTELLEREGSLPAPRATEIVIQAAAALQVAHDQGIVHRDLKPDNIMVAEERDGGERVKVVDFDIALGPPEGEGARVTRHGYVVGTPEYMSPEQLTGDELDGRSDLYSLALVLFRMLTGRLPFEDGSAQEVMLRRLTEEPLPLEQAAPGAGIPPGLEPVVRRALARRAADRQGSPVELADEIRRAMGRPRATSTAAGEAAPPATSDEGTIPPTRVSPAPGGLRPRRPALLAGAGAALAAVLVGGVLLVGNGPGDDGPEGATTGDPDPPAQPERAAAGAGEEPGAAAADDDPAPGDPRPGGDEPEAERDEDAPAPDGAADPIDAPEPGPAEEDPDGPVLQRDATLTLPAESPTETILRMIQRMDPRGAGADLARGDLAAVRDTLEAVWAQASMSRADSASTAHTLSAVMGRLGDREASDAWFERAERLEEGR